MSDLSAIIVFLANLVFFIWFGATLNSIDRHVRNVADHAERHTRLLASIANATLGPDEITGTQAQHLYYT